MFRLNSWEVGKEGVNFFASKICSGLVLGFFKGFGGYCFWLRSSFVKKKKPFFFLGLIKRLPA